VNVLVDTSVWSRALRRAQPHSDEVTRELTNLIQEGRAVIIGPIRQELLSGVANPAQFNLLRNHLRAFPDVPIATPDYEEAAAFFTRCRARGIQGSNVDFLICAVACRQELSIFTSDKDLAAFAGLLPITLHRTR
jgi:predicted nucleic acid-binding protein